ncbi:DUF6986 family protein [Nocardia sp. NPDC003963]
MSGNDIDALLARIDDGLARSDQLLADRYPGEPSARQPVHTVYIPGDRYDEHTVREWGARAVELLDEHGDTDALGIPDPASEQPAGILDRVRAKLGTEPIEDLRIDFEDGYGDRPDDLEDREVLAAARALAASVHAGTAPPNHGLRFKSLAADTRRRGLRTLGLFVGELAELGALTDGFVMTLPKVTAVEQVEALVEVCAWYERELGITSGTLRFEIQVETPQSIIAPDGTFAVARMIHASGGRCLGLHYGTYDYSAACGIPAAYQRPDHPAADHAKMVMQIAAAGTSVRVVDGSSNVLPVGDRDAVRRAWQLHGGLVHRALGRGLYQGWDLHPGQLVSRYAATYAFFRSGLDASAARLRAFVRGGESGFLDEPATAAALAGFIVRGLECGAVDVAEAENLTAADRRQLLVLARRGGAAPAVPRGK